MIRRPKPGETEDDILQMQEAFTNETKKADFKPVVNIINARKHKAEESISSEASKHLKCDPSTSQQPKDDSEDEELADDNVHFPKIIPPLIGNIIEKNILTKKAESSVTLKSDPIKTSNSIFAQRVRQKRVIKVEDSDTNKKDKMDVDNDLTNIKLKNLDTFKQSVILKDVYKDVHNDNLALLNSMTEEEILEEKHKLLATIKPESLEFLKSLRKKSNPIDKEPKLTKNEVKQNIEQTNDDMSVDVLDNEVLTHPHLHNWINFDTLEKDKLEWIKYFKPNNSQIDNKQLYEARFDFKGYLLPYVTDYNEDNKTLFHHAEEPHRPGYSLKELFQLCRSSVPQQRSMALNTLAGVMDYYSIGIYDDIIDIPVTKIYFVLRFALDENIPNILEPALKGLRNMFYNKVDEMCIDNLLGTEYGLYQPKLYSTKTEIDDNESEMDELKDFHVVELDLINGSIRTDILPRIRYILYKLNPSFNCVQYCLQILIRIARHSVECAEGILKVEGLIECIFKQYLPVSIPDYGNIKSNSACYKLICNSLKLIRIMISQSKSILSIFNNKFKLIELFLNYVGNLSATTAYLMQIQSETHYILTTMLSYEIGAEHLQKVLHICFLTLNNHINNINIPDALDVLCNHCSSTINLMNVFAANSLVHNADIIEQLDELIYAALLKWCSQITVIKTISFNQLNLIAITFDCLSSITRRGYYSSFNNTQLKECIEKMIQSNGFNIICSNIEKSSNLLSSDSIYKHPNGTNIGRLNTIIFGHPDKLVPTIRDSSPIYFISSLCKYLHLYKDSKIFNKLLYNKYILKYIQNVSHKKNVSLHDNWFTRIELGMICNFIILLNVNIDDEIKDTIYKMSFKLTYLLPSIFKQNLKYIINNIIFNKEWFTTHRLLINMNITDTNNILNDLPNIKKFYINILHFNEDTKLNNLFISDWNQAVLPKDWIYMPILGLYMRNNDPKTESNQLSTEAINNLVQNCLKWILVSEICFPDITREMSLTDRFCRIMCIFLCDNSVFLDPIIKPLIQKCVKLLFDVEKSNKFNFDKPLMGISNFQELYTQFVDHFQAVSYGDPTFASCLLVPLSQKHDIKWRKLVWSEYGACLRALDCPEDMLCYPLDDYLNPPETDMSLLKCYFRAINSNMLRVGTISYKIAHHHIECAKQRQQNKK